MSFNYYKISRYGSDEHKFISKWTNIVDYVEIYGHIEISNYLKLENSFIKFLKMFYDCKHPTNPLLRWHPAMRQQLIQILLSRQAS